MTTRIRPARPGDGAGCAEVWLDTGRHYHALDPQEFQVPSADGLAESFEEDIANADPDHLRLVAEVEGVVGLLVAGLRRPGGRPDHELIRDLSRVRLFVEALAVAEPYRRSGVGTALMEAAEAWGRERGVEVVQLNTYAHSPTSVPFYEHRIGYARRAIVFRRALS